MKTRGQGMMQMNYRTIHQTGRQWLQWASLASLAVLMAGCTGPSMKRLSDQRLSRLDPSERVGVYIGKVDVPYEPVALIDSDAFSAVDDEVKSRQLDQLRARARSLGANAVQDVRILPKKVRGFSVDERTPFESWKQGEYDLYFMRGMAIRLNEEEPSNLKEIEPASGWLADNLPVPPRLDKPLDEPLPAPPLRTP